MAGGLIQIVAYGNQDASAMSTWREKKWVDYTVRGFSGDQMEWLPLRIWSSLAKASKAWHRA